MIVGVFCFSFVLADNLININTASLEELDTLPGIGPAKAQAIIDYRTITPFQTIEDIKNVSGIGEATFENIKDLITVGEPTSSPSPEGNLDEEPENPVATSTPEFGDDEDDTPLIPSQEGTEEEDEEILEYKLGDAVINEFVSDPSDEDVEWIELYSVTEKIADLNDWTIEEGSGAKTILTGNFQNRFFVIEKPKGNLNNKGDIIILRDSAGNLIDKVLYGDWDDGSFGSNAPVAEDPYSTARKFDGQNTFNNFENFSLTTTPTKGKSNIVVNPNKEDEEITAEERAMYDYNKNIIITEIFPNPEGSDNDLEFVEIFNNSDVVVNLLGWGLGDNSKSKYIFEEKKINPKEYFVIYRSESKIALNNGAENVKLYQPLRDTPLENIKYEKSVEGWSYSYNQEKNEWTWSEIVTPGKENIIKTVNHPPLVNFDCPESGVFRKLIFFDASDTIDEDGDELKFIWELSDEFESSEESFEHGFMLDGVYTIKLTVSDGENEATKEKIITIINPSLIDDDITSLEPEADQAEIIINEILPNPVDSDAEGEWIEIYNRGGAEINLFNWKVDDEEGGSSAYTFSSSIFLSPKQFYVLDRSESKIALNNTTDSVRLFNGLEDLVDQVDYSEVDEGEAYARGENDKWFWTTAPTPGEENIISISKSDSVAKVTAVLSGTGSSSKTKEKVVVETTLEKVRDFEVGDLVKVSGTVAVLPGVFGTQYFYITGSPGLQVYSYNKNFPELKIGDLVEVAGELSQINGEKRLKTKEAGDIKIIEYKGLPEPSLLTCDKAGEENIGELITVVGEVTEIKGSTIYLDDGSEEVLIYIKKGTGINIKNYNEGEIASVTGIMSNTTTGPKLMPRSADDIIKKDIETNNQGRVLGEISVSDEWTVAGRDKKLELFKYLLVIAGAIIVLLSGFLIKIYREDS